MSVAHTQCLFPHDYLLATKNWGKKTMTTNVQVSRQKGLPGTIDECPMGRIGGP
jgi:hypothetical protein